METSQTTKKSKDSNIFSFDLHTLNSEYEDIQDVKILETYSIGAASIKIAQTKSGKGLYLIDEPIMSDDEGKLYSVIMKQLFLSAQPLTDLKKEKLDNYLKKQITSVTNSFGISKSTHAIFDKLLYYLKRDVQNYGIIGPLMDDPEIEDILCENYDNPVGIIHRRYSELGILDTNIRFGGIREMNGFVQKLVQRCGKSITAAVPYVDAITENGHRVSATFGKEISLPGPNFAIRKFSLEPYTIINLIKFGTLNPMIAAYVWLLLDVKALILVIGPTSAGKTTTMGSFLAMVDFRGKITTIEDTPELKLSHKHWQRLITRKSYNIMETKYDINMGTLVSLALRSRPDYIVVGEVRGEEAAFLIQAAATGHGGLTSFHASDAQSALVRLDSPPLNVKLAGQMLIWCFIQQNKVSYNKKIVRRIFEISEVIPQNNSIRLQKIFEWDPTSDKFAPYSIDELIDKSYRLKEVMSLKGLSKEGLRSDLEKRQQFIETLVSKNIEKYQDVVKEFSLFNLQNLGE
jgi:flagellar protein FlaI